MTNVNAKAIKTKTVQAAYDLCVAHFQNDPDGIPGDQSPKDHVMTALSDVLKTLNFPRVGDLPALIRTHDASVKNKKVNRFTIDTADDTALIIAGMVTQTEFTRTDSTGTDAADATSEDDSTDETANDGEAPSVSTDADRSAASQAPTPVAGTYTVANGAEALINPTIQAATNNTVPSISALLGAYDEVAEKVAEVQAVIDAHEAAIAAYKTGDNDVDESAIVKPGQFTPTGYADLDAANPMVPVLDSLIGQYVTPGTSFGDIVGAIQSGEDTLADAALRLKTLGRELRQARPKERRTVATQSPANSHAESLSEIDDLNRSVEVVFEAAADLFPNCYGASQNILQFDVPKLEFDGPHPNVPAKDDSFRFNTRVVVEALHSIAEGEIIWLYGEAGCGKSEFWAQIAAHLNMPFTRMNMDGHLTRSDIIGVNRLMPGEQGGTEMRFVEGILPRAMSQPGLLLIDEMDLGDPEIMPILQPVLEGNPLVLLEDGGRIVQPHPMFRIAITGNTIGLGSDNQMYLNAFEQSAATRDRISAFVHMPYMPAEIEEQVVLARHPGAEPEFVTNLVKLANKVRDGYRNGDVQTLFSTRAVLYCAKRYSRLADLYPSPDAAAHDILETVIMNRLDSGSTQTVKELVDQIFA